MVTKVEKPPAPPAGEGGAASPGVESLDAIAAAGAQLDAPVVDARQEQQILASEAEELAGAMKALRAALIPFAPDHVQQPLGVVWSDAQLLEICKAIVECCRAQGITVDAFFGKHGHWIKLAVSLGMPALATLKLLKTPPPPPPAQVVHGQQQPA